MLRKLIAAALAASVAALLAAPALADTRTIKVGDDWFVHKGDPRTVTVRKGTRVRWTWVGGHTHNVRVKRGPVKFHSDLMDSGVFSHKMRRVGTYKIVCNVHQPDMRMTLRVIR
jgi:plastocyanin